MPNMPAISTQQSVDLLNVQGDVWSRGFPKRFETYYFFSIKEGENKAFSQCLRRLVDDKTPLISTLAKVKDDHQRIANFKKQGNETKGKASNVKGENQDDSAYPVANALIAFTREGLEAIQRGFADSESLDLFSVQLADPAFYGGMTRPEIVNRLNDPPSNSWDDLFHRPERTIHAMLKIGGSSEVEVTTRLKRIQNILQLGTVISDVAPNSRLDGCTRPEPHRGKEHFGFQDHISQPLMEGIDVLEAEEHSFSMRTDPSLLIVSDKTQSEADGGLVKRPKWMNGGSFLVFRKLEQDVPAFEALTSRYLEHGCLNKEHMGAKLMGRWASGAPIAMPAFHSADSGDAQSAKLLNNFVYGGDICPASAHIRKTNPRNLPGTTGQNFPRAHRAKMIRNGIPYGSDYNGDPADTTKRGLLFACYQSHIEDGFEQLQIDWANSPIFPEAGIGLDPIIGQVNGTLDTFITTNTTIDSKKDSTNTKRVSFRQFVTMRGGGYFFVPSISALRETLGQA